MDEGSCDESDTGFKLFGGWMFNQYVGGEVEYIDGGTVGDNSFGIDSTGINASLKGNWHVNQNFDLFGKVGYYFWDADIDLSGNSGQEANESGSDLSWGLGAGYNITDNISVVAEWQWFQIEEADADFMSANFVGKFSDLLSHQATKRARRMAGSFIPACRRRAVTSTEVGRSARRRQRLPGRRACTNSNRTGKSWLRSTP